MSRVQADDVSTLLGMRFDPTPVSDASFVFEITEGPSIGRSFVLDATQPPAVLVGQSPACPFRIEDEAVSRRHASLDLVGRRVRITDLGSKNGTFVDGVAIVDAYLVGGEIVRFGSTALRVARREGVAPQLPLTTRFGRVIGASTEMRRLYPVCERLAASNVPVILEGETGTGKEALAEAIHEVGPRASGPFVVLDCVGVPGTLLEAELFGHERGAFTGAVTTRKGVLELAHGGTLLIDEIGDLEPSLQPKLLRAVERGEIRRLGGDKVLRVDVRILAATRRDLDREVSLGRFRDDLFHRLAVARVELPPLRRRKGDVGLLAAYFWKQLGGPAEGPDPKLLARWERETWPGNVRELRNAVARELTLGGLEGRGVASEDAPAASSPEADARGVADVVGELLKSPPPFSRARQIVLQDFERRYLARVLELHQGDVAKAAAASGIGRRYFQMLSARSRISTPR